MRREFYEDRWWQGRMGGNLLQLNDVVIGKVWVLWYSELARVIILLVEWWFDRKSFKDEYLLMV